MENSGKIIRIWKGWTSLKNAPLYEQLLKEKIFPDVKKKGVKGLEKVSISIQILEDEVEFLLFLQFDSIHSVKTFAGENYKTAYIPVEAKKVLKRYDQTAQHYELKSELRFLGN